jgi:hypothetical protein
MAARRARHITSRTEATIGTMGDEQIKKLVENSLRVDLERSNLKAKLQAMDTSILGLEEATSKLVEKRKTIRSETLACKDEIRRLTFHEQSLEAELENERLVDICLPLIRINS